MNLIWNNDACAIYDDLKKDPEYQKMNDTDLWSEAYHLVEDYLGDEVSNLNIDKDNKIILIGNVVHWNGSFSAYKILDTNNIGKALRQAISSFDGENSFEIYEEDGSLKLSQRGHDNPVSPSIIEFRVLTTDFDELDNDKPETLIANSKSLGADAAKVYGWNAA